MILLTFGDFERVLEAVVGLLGILPIVIDLFFTWVRLGSVS